MARPPSHFGYETFVLVYHHFSRAGDRTLCSDCMLRHMSFQLKASVAVSKMSDGYELDSIWSALASMNR